VVGWLDGWLVGRLLKNDDETAAKVDGPHPPTPPPRPHPTRQPTRTKLGLGAVALDSKLQLNDSVLGRRGPPRYACSASEVQRCRERACVQVRGSMWGWRGEDQGRGRPAVARATAREPPAHPSAAWPPSAPLPALGWPAQAPPSGLRRWHPRARQRQVGAPPPAAPTLERRG